jgi:hypothetical protein
VIALLVLPGGSSSASGAVAGAPAPSYQLTTIPSLGGIRVFPYSLNNAGDVAGTASIAGPACNDGTNVCGPEHAFAFINGQDVDLGPSWPAYGINDSDTVVGGGTGSGSAFVFAGGSITPLFPPGAEGAAFALNNPGSIAAVYFPNGERKAAVISPDGTITAIPPPVGYADLVPTAINDLGQVIGRLDNSASFLWDGTTTQVIPEASAINDAGTIVGPPANDINNSGEIVSGANSLIRGGNTYPMTALVPWAPTWDVIFGTTLINDFGDIVGKGLLHQDAPHLHAKDWAWIARPFALIGSRTTQAKTDYNPAGTAEAFRMPAVGSGGITTLRVYLDSTSQATSVILGIYTGDHPKTLIASGVIDHPAAGHWNGVSFSSSVPVISNTKYWVAILAPNGAGTVRFRDACCGSSKAGTPSETSNATDLRDLPANWKTGTTYKNDGPLSTMGDTG